MAAFRRGHLTVVERMMNHVTEFTSDTELSRLITTISDKVTNIHNVFPNRDAILVVKLHFSRT